MKAVDNDSLKKYANNLMFNIKDSEYATLKSEFDVLLKQVEMLEEIDGISNYEPMDYPFVLENSYLREDEAKMSLDKGEAFKNSKDVSDGCVKAPRVV